MVAAVAITFWGVIHENQIETYICQVLDLQYLRANRMAKEIGMTTACSHKTMLSSLQWTLKFVKIFC